MNMLKVWTSTEDIIISIIKPHKDFSDTINQHKIADEFMETRNENMTPQHDYMYLYKLYIQS